MAFRAGRSHGGLGPGAAVVSRLDSAVERKDYASAVRCVASNVDWRTPVWHAKSASQLRTIWESGVDAKWGVMPSWRALARREDEGGLQVYSRECVPFRVMVVTIRLTQTLHVAKGKSGPVIKKCVIKRH